MVRKCGRAQCIAVAVGEWRASVAALCDQAWHGAGDGTRTPRLRSVRRPNERCVGRTLGKRGDRVKNKVNDTDY